MGRCVCRNNDVEIAEWNAKNRARMRAMTRARRRGEKTFWSKTKEIFIEKSEPFKASKIYRKMKSSLLYFTSSLSVGCNEQQELKSERKRNIPWKWEKEIFIVSWRWTLRMEMALAKALASRKREKCLIKIINEYGNERNQWSAIKICTDIE